jgi:hypothetical protein
MKDTILKVHPYLATLQLILANLKMIKINEQLTRGLIVSSQAYEGDPLYGSSFMAAMAKAAEINGVVGIRAIRTVTHLPIIGLYKVFSPDSEVYITPDFEAADQISQADCDIITVDATHRPRKNGLCLTDLINFIHQGLYKPVMADTSCLKGVAKIGSLFLDEARRVVNDLALAPMKETVIAATKLEGAFSSLVGAALLAGERQIDSED